MSQEDEHMADNDNTERSDTLAAAEPRISADLTWADPTTGTTAAILITTSGISVVEVRRAEATSAFATRVVGDPCTNQVSHLYGVDCWVGDNSKITSGMNRIATQVMYQLIRDVHDGDYVATDRERAHAHGLLANLDGLLEFHGPFLITGASTTDSAVSLDENFRRWFTAGTGDITQIRDSLRTIVATERGIPAGEVVVTAAR
jgi:hypothetical protein